MSLFLCTGFVIPWAQSGIDCPTATAINPSVTQSVCVGDAAATLTAEITPNQATGYATDWLDLSGNGYDAVLQNGVGYDTANGGVLTFDGVDDYALGDTNPAINTAQAFTIEYWIYFNSLYDNFPHPIVVKVNGQSDAFVTAFVPSSQFSGYGTFTFGHRANARMKINDAIAINTWYQILISYNGNGFSTPSNFKIYINNVERTILNANAFATSSNINGFFYDGGLSRTGNAKLPIYNLYLNKEFNSAEVSQHWDYYKDRFGIGTSNPSTQVFGATVSLDSGNPLSYNPGSNTAAYQWYYNTTDSNLIAGATLIQGATSTTYTPPSTTDDLGSRWYFCVGYSTDSSCGQTNATQTLASNTTQITLYDTPNLTITNPEAVYIPATVNLTDPNITAGSDSGTLSYWTDPSATNQLTTPESVSASGTYYIKLTNTGGCYTIKPVAVTITERPPIVTTPLLTLTGEITAPGRMAVDTDDNVYVINAIQHSIIKYDAQGNYLATIATDFNPISIALDKNNNLFAGDQISGNIYSLASNGTKSIFYSGTDQPNAMVFGLKNILYVADSKLKKVIGLDGSGTVVSNFTSENFVFPTGIAYDKQNNHFIVSEHGGIGEDVQYCYSGQWDVSSWGPVTTVYILDEDGNLINQFGCFGTKDGEFQRIMGVSMGTCGNIYVVDPYLGRVNVYDSSGNYLTKFGFQGDGDGELNLPMDIVFTSDNRAFVSSMNKGAIDIFSITDALPTATITSEDQTICTDATGSIEINFTGNGPWSFTYTVDKLNPISLNANESPFSFEVTEPGLYEVTAVTDSNDVAGACFTGSTLISASLESPSVTALSNTVVRCHNDTSGIELQFTGTPPYQFTYTIDNGQPIEGNSANRLHTLIPEISGLYEIIAMRDDGCSGSISNGSVDVVVNALPSASLDLTGNQILINPGVSGDVDIYFTGSAPYTFTYIRDEVNPTSITTSDNPYKLTLSEKGTYEIISINDQYCTNTDWQCFFDIAISENVTPTASLTTSDFYVCSGESTMLSIDFTGASPWTFTYTIDGIPAGTLTADQSPYQLLTSTPGVYELSALTDGLDNSGTFSGSAVVIENPLPIINLADTYTLCQGNSIVLDPGDFESYQWNNNSTNQTLTINMAGFYSVMVTDQNGCTNSATVEVIENPLPVLDLGPDVDICEGGSTYTLDAGLFDSYLWSDGSTGRTLEVSAEGTYSVTVTNGYGCSATDLINVLVHSFLNSDFYYDINRFEVQFISNATEADAHYWEFGDNTTSTEENPIHTYSKKGNYTVTYTAINHYCGTLEVSKVIPVGSNTDTDVLVIYPNPSYGAFTIKITPLAPITSNIGICINSTSGQTIYAEVFDPYYITQYDGSMYIPVNIENFDKGIYIVYINAENFAEQEKLVLKD
ncbi:PKD domain-containing protein [Aestuariivivens sediminis]|uniref:PKD domain-containing protein n=1 Tax=Aestuariivivens sediminis TaxID=2913557 RepID=UPI001F59F4A5|nr:PKD domain-containing protein [Aestuariivivens sediminis]